MWRPQPPPTSTTFTDFHRPQLEQPPRPHLQLPGIAQPRADRAVEVEKQAAVGRVLEVVLVGDVEDIERRLELLMAPEIDGARDAHIPGEERVVLAQGVPRQHAPVRAVAVGWRRGPLTARRRERAERAR